MSAAAGRQRRVVAAAVDEAAAGDIASCCGLSPLTARLLVARGVDSVEEVQRFLEPSLERDWLDPADIPGLPAAAERIALAIERHERILVFGDFDVDGITATTVSVRGLRAFGADVVGLIPHRYDEGYALSERAIERAMTYEPAVVMTVDCGISCGPEVASLLARGVDVVITDHHEPGGHVPQHVPVADPKLREGHPSRELAGAGVALKLICLLGPRFGKPDAWRELTDFAALGTLADLMPLVGENRALVAHGLAHLRERPRTCFLALAACCGVQTADITSSKLSFSFIPRLNAAGRMGDATVAYELLMSDEREQAERCAGMLERINDERREAESVLEEQVRAVLDATFDEDAPIIVVAGEGWHEGVKGIVASRIARAYRRPTLVFSIEDDVARGSGRTYGSLNLFELASTCSDMYEQFGGHAAAIGITLPAAALDELNRRLCAQLGAAVPVEDDTVEVDALVTLEECGVEAFDELAVLEPFGNGNRLPLLAARGVFLEKRQTVGKQGTHLRYTATDGLAHVQGIYFSPDELERLLACDQACDVVFEPSIDEWRGKRTAKLMTRDIVLHAATGAVHDAVGTRVEELFERFDDIVDTGEYAGIAEAARFNTKVVGVTFENRQDVLSGLEAGVELALVREPGNEMDANAIAVRLLDGRQLGYLNRRLAAKLAPAMDGGIAYDAAVSAVTGGPLEPGGDVRSPGPLGVRDPGVTARSYGVNIVVRRPDAEQRAEQPALAGESPAELRRRWQAIAPDALDDALREALIGEHALHDAQARTLSLLARGRSTLTVMATGRGKSLIFHLHAARIALRDGAASVFVYPLRALVADQAYHLQQTFAQFGLTACVLTGESDAAERARVYDGLAGGDIDVVLTTPEYLCIHADAFAASGRVRFVVVDEAHHIGTSKAGKRPAYQQLSAALDALGRPLVLAVTATAGDEEATLIRDTLGIEELVCDATVRENLRIDDRRDLRARESYVASLMAGGDKCIVYVNSREQSMTLTRELRRRLPELAPRIAFYNAGLGKADRKLIEDAFRDGRLTGIVATSAFGEGIDIPDVAHVVLFHLPFSEIEFNQMSGRAGRDGRAAGVHLLFSYGDARINERILAASAPSRDAMVALYKALRASAKEAAAAGEDAFCITNAELAERARRLGAGKGLEESGVSCGISVFRELGFLETSGHGIARHITMVEGPAHMELADSTRYREGQEEQEGFAAFKRWALGADADELLARFNRPILPHGL